MFKDYLRGGCKTQASIGCVPFMGSSSSSVVSCLGDRRCGESEASSWDSLSGVTSGDSGVQEGAVAFGIETGSGLISPANDSAVTGGTSGATGGEFGSEIDSKT